MKFLQSKTLLIVARILLNVAIWLFLLIGALGNALTYVEAHNVTNEVLFVKQVLTYNSIFIVAVYFNSLVLLPLLLYRKKTTAYFIAVTLWLLSITALQGCYLSRLTEQYPALQVFDITSVALALEHNADWWGNFLLVSLPSVLLFLIISSVWRLVIQLLKVNRQHELIKQQQTEAELTQLKAQINPHFLFNVLNSLYALSLQQSTQTPEAILKLSDILRYMLYDTTAPFVSIEKELAMLQNYVALEQTRVGAMANITIEVNTDYQPYNIAPALLIVFVENAIKHGIDSMTSNAFLHITIRIFEAELQLSVRNNYKPKLKPNAVGGIGLTNVTKRIKLLYEKQHKLKISDMNNIFDVTLTLNLR